MSAAHGYDDVHRLVDRLAPDQLEEVRAHVLRLAASRRRFVPWESAHATAQTLPRVDYEQFREDVDTVFDADSLLGDDR